MDKEKEKSRTISAHHQSHLTQLERDRKSSPALRKSSQHNSSAKRNESAKNKTETILRPKSSVYDQHKESIKSNAIHRVTFHEHETESAKQQKMSNKGNQTSAQ